MNLSESPTEEELADLLGACDDAADDHVTWVDLDGNVYVESVTQYNARNGGDPSPEEKFRFEVSERGSGHVGPDAARDARFVHESFEVLAHLWATDFVGYSGSLGVRGSV
jgi:hypothetical protein